MAVENELEAERGPDKQSRKAAEELLNELDQRATTYELKGKGGKIIRKGP